MREVHASRRAFLKLTGTVAGAGLVSPCFGLGNMGLLATAKSQTAEPKADYTLRIAASPIEIAHNRIVSGITYNDKFPGPLLRFKEGQPVVVDVFNIGLCFGCLRFRCRQEVHVYVSEAGADQTRPSDHTG